MSPTTRIAQGLFILFFSGVAYSSIVSSDTKNTSTPEQKTSPETTSSFELKPYTANYIFTRKNKKRGTASRILNKISQYKWELIFTSKASTFFFTDNRVEHSIFNWKKQTIQPLFYQYIIKNSFKTKQTEEVFDWTKKTITGHNNKKKWQYKFPPDITDPLNHQILFGKFLSKDKTLKNLPFTVSEKGQGKNRSYKVQASETLTIGTKKYNSIKLIRKRPNRSTIIWLAEELNFIPVKIYQEKDGEEQATLTLSDVKFSTK